MSVRALRNPLPKNLLKVMELIGTHFYSTLINCYANSVLQN